LKHLKTPKGTELPLMDIKGKPYLTVQSRLLWFREDHPDWSITTEVVQTDANGSIMKATIKDLTGNIVSTGHKTETKSGFADHLEKAESGSIGRALGFLGYGTQFALELDEGDRIVEAPSEPKKKVLKEPPSFPLDITKYKVKFGKQKGRELGSFDVKELRELLSKTEEYCESKGEPPEEMIEFLDVALLHLEKMKPATFDPQEPMPEVYKPSKTQVDLLYSMATQKGWTKQQMDSFLKESFGTIDITTEQLEKAIKTLTNFKKETK
jgi:hypothetical protein